jgi:hypothetical protein
VAGAAAAAGPSLLGAPPPPAVMQKTEAGGAGVTGGQQAAGEGWEEGEEGQEGGEADEELDQVAAELAEEEEGGVPGIVPPEWAVHTRVPVPQGTPPLHVPHVPLPAALPTSLKHRGMEELLAALPTPPEQPEQCYGFGAAGAATQGGEHWVTDVQQAAGKQGYAARVPGVMPGDSIALGAADEQERQRLAGRRTTLISQAPTAHGYEIHKEEEEEGMVLVSPARMGHGTWSGGSSERRVSEPGEWHLVEPGGQGSPLRVTYAAEGKPGEAVGKVLVGHASAPAGPVMHHSPRRGQEGTQRGASGALGAVLAATVTLPPSITGTASPPVADTESSPLTAPGALFKALESKVAAAAGAGGKEGAGPSPEAPSSSAGPSSAPQPTEQQQAEARTPLFAGLVKEVAAAQGVPANVLGAPAAHTPATATAVRKDAPPAQETAAVTTARDVAPVRTSAFPDAPTTFGREETSSTGEAQVCVRGHAAAATQLLRFLNGAALSWSQDRVTCITHRAVKGGLA